jgi:MFS family permease
MLANFMQWALGTVIGPLLGGGFSQSGNWEWIFWINLPFIGVGGTMIITFLSLNYSTSLFLVKLRRVDWIGSCKSSLCMMIDSC